MKPKIKGKISEECLDYLKIIQSVEESKWNTLSTKLIYVINKALDSTNKKKAQRVLDVFIYLDDNNQSLHSPLIKFNFDNGEWLTFDMFTLIDSSLSGISATACSIMYAYILFDSNERYESALEEAIKSN